MNLTKLKKFAQGARRTLRAEVASRLDYVLQQDDVYTRGHAAEIQDIRARLKQRDREQIVEEVAYTWFNRLLAFRYMDLRGYTQSRVVSPQPGQVQPEILFQIKQGRTPKTLASLQSTFDGYLSGRTQSAQPDREIYTRALLGICNEYNTTLPFLFRKVDSYMAVLLPSDLLSDTSIIAEIQNAITEDDVEDVEIIGWLYQFYISEKKDQVFGRPKGEKIKKEDIPAATQLFTPHWIVRYMVENSLGRLWRNNRPETGLKDQMEYYIEGDPEPEFLTIEGPEEITLLDPACGSGHILTYAFDLLYGMYEEAGYSAEEIPSLILTNNLYGIDIDTRAAELASFALTMKAREKDRFFFKRGVVPRVIAMEDVSVDLREAGITMSPDLQEAFGYLSEATNFGSLIPVPAEVQREIEELLAQLDARGDADLFADQAMGQVRSGLRQLGYLARRYHCVVTNPPYMGSKGMNGALQTLIENRYRSAKADLMTVFVSSLQLLTMHDGMIGAVTLDSWLSLSGFTAFRTDLLNTTTIHSLVHIGWNCFPHGHTYNRGVAFILVKGRPAIAGVFFDLSNTGATVDKRELFNERKQRGDFFRCADREFRKIPNCPIAYWIGPTEIDLYRKNRVADFFDIKEGTGTRDDERFVRFRWEISQDKIGTKWFSVDKAGGYYRWWGPYPYVLDWENDGERIRAFPKNRVGNTQFFFREAVSWGKVGSGLSSFRYRTSDFTFLDAAPSVFGQELSIILGYLNSTTSRHLHRVQGETINVTVGATRRLPFIEPPADSEIRKNTQECVSLATSAGILSEQVERFERHALISDYSSLPNQYAVDDLLLYESWPSISKKGTRLNSQYDAFVRTWEGKFLRLLDLESKNNRLFAGLYGLHQVPVDVPFEEVSILKDELDSKALERGAIVFKLDEVLKQFVSYGVGCIFGRYSLDKDGLILANAGDDLDAYLSQIPTPTLRPDESGILPITDDNDFADDLPSQWRTFLRAAFGDEHYEENLRFLEDGLGKRLRAYFLKGFYEDHVKRYKKRPIYWLITSPKGTLQALIYLHRYNRDTINRFLNDYLRPYQQKLEAKRVSAEHVLTGGGSSQNEKTKAQKRIDEIRKALEELSTWERDVVRPLAEKRIELDLDDGVKVNYGKLGAILAKVKGLNG